MKKILVVDDEQDLCSLVKKSLEKTGKYIVVTTSLPEEVLGLCAREKPDLILLDIVMPNMDGNEILASLKKQKPQASKPLIVVTSGLGEMVYLERSDKWRWLPNRKVVHERGRIIEEKEAHRAALEYGVDDFIAKPFSPGTLRAVVQEVFDKREKKQKEKDGGQENGVEG